MNTKDLRTQLTDLKAKITSILTFETLFEFEEEVLNDLFNLIDNIMLDKIEDKMYSVEEIADMRILEYKIILEGSKNKKIQRLVKQLQKGINW